ncbi:MAG: hypothetical protein Q7T51_03675 [Candidatus Moranbacteria bacterium]|nr:hypothetical protein [Candidatus Moranbacteria bacterium]
MKTGFLIEYARRHWILFRRVFLHKKNLQRDLLVIVLSIIIAALFILVDKDVSFRSIGQSLFANFNWQKTIEISDNKPVELSDEAMAVEIHTVQGMFNLNQWKDYRSQWYGIEIKYPETWNAPVARAAASGSKWEYKYQFSKKDVKDSDLYAGFDLMVYNLAKTKEVSNTEEFPVLKNIEQCQNAQVHLIETGDYPAEEIYVPQSDDCYNPTLFFSFTRGEYIYNLVPFVKPGVEMLGDPRVEIVDNFPEFFAAASSLNIVDIVRPKPVVVVSKPRVYAPMPITFKKSSKGLVCAKANDHPSKSNKGKGKHMDMECCLDPDEYPNPNCHYSESKYGKYL